jgi:hypothetical protein
MMPVRPARSVLVALYLQLSTATPLPQAVTCASVQAATSVAVAEQLVWLQSQLFKVES